MDWPGPSPTFFPSPAPPTTRWHFYWTLIVWYLTQGGRVAVSAGIASFVWLLFALLPGALATLVLIGQYDDNKNMQEGESVFSIMRDILDDPGNYNWIADHATANWHRWVAVELEPGFIATAKGRAGYWVSVKVLRDILCSYEHGSSFCVTLVRRADGSAYMKLYVRRKE